MTDPKEIIDDFDEDDDLEEKEFIPCSKCDGHPACEDFGCAIELGCHIGKDYDKYGMGLY